MTSHEPASGRMPMAFGAFSLALIVGALAFQYLGGLPPCEMCHWQRWPHIAAAIVGIGGGLLVQTGLIGRKQAPIVAILTIALIAVSGFLGVYHAGVEWKWWAGPQACTGPAFQLTGGTLDLNAPMPRCDEAAWRLFGISLAGYNAILSLGAAVIGTVLISRTRKLR